MKTGPQDGSKGGQGGVQKSMFFGVMLALGAQLGQDGPKTPQRHPKDPQKGHQNDTKMVPKWNKK